MASAVLSIDAWTINVRSLIVEIDGDVDSFPAWKLGGVSVHVTDCSRACTTGYDHYSAENGIPSRSTFDFENTDGLLLGGPAVL